MNCTVNIKCEEQNIFMIIWVITANFLTSQADPHLSTNFLYQFPPCVYCYLYIIVPNNFNSDLLEMSVFNKLFSTQCNSIKQPIKQLIKYLKYLSRIKKSLRLDVFYKLTELRPKSLRLLEQVLAWGEQGLLLNNRTPYWTLKFFVSLD